MASSNGNGNGTPEPSAVATAAALGGMEGLLGAILAELRSETAEVGVSDAYGREIVLEQHPVAGSKRILAYRTGNGFDNLTVPTTGLLALGANEARLGCTFVNAGAAAVILYLSDHQKTGAPAVWLAANGGSWDGRFGDLPWSGNVFAVAQGAPSTLVGGEI